MQRDFERGTALDRPALYDRNFAIAFLAQLLFTFSNSCFLAHYPRWVTHLGGDEAVFGLIWCAANLVALLVRPWMGPLIDGRGARMMWSLGGAIFVPSVMLLLLLDGNGPLMVLLRVLAAVSTALIFASSLTYISETAPPERRIEAIGVLGSSGFLGLLLGPMAGDLFLGDGHRSFTDFVIVFGMIGGGTLASIGMVWLLRPETNSNPTRLASPAFVKSIRSHWPGPILMINLMFGACLTVPFGFVSQYVDRVGFQDTTFFFVGYASFGLVVRLTLRDLAERIGTNVVLLIGMAFFGFGMWSFLLFDPGQMGWLFVPSLLCGTGHALVFHTMVAQSIAPFPPEARGSGSVLALMAIDLGAFASAVPLGFMAKYLGYGWLFGSVGSACFVVAILYVFHARRWPIQAAQANGPVVSVSTGIETTAIPQRRSMPTRGEYPIEPGTREELTPSPVGSAP